MLNSLDPYGKGLCTKQCTDAPYCGDGRIAASKGETCDGQVGCDRTTCKWIGVD